MRFLALFLSLASAASAGEYAVLASGSRMHVDRHEIAGDKVRLYMGDSFAEMKIRAKDAHFNFPYLYDGETEITSGLQPGDEVVVTGVDKLQEGAKVSVAIQGEQPGGRGGGASKKGGGKKQ